jgi:hypothetical protein
MQPDHPSPGQLVAPEVIEEEDVVESAMDGVNTDEVIQPFFHIFCDKLCSVGND